MKIRNGFVSNSSSSSFIISDNKYPNVRSIATYMIEKQIKDSEYDNDSWSKEYIIKNKKYLDILKELDENKPISFPSCNYDTYIRKVGDCYLVNTCNNTDWKLDNYNVKLTESAINELKKLKIQYKGTKTGKKIKQVIKQKYDEFPTFGNDFYSLDEEIEGIETYDYCNNHEKSYMYPMWDTLKYGKICLDCHPHKKRLQRREKLNKINQSIVK